MRSDMRTLLLIIMVVSFAVIAGAQTLVAPKLNVLADSVQRDRDTTQLHGHVQIAACSVVTADDAVLKSSTDEATLSGNVRMKLTNGVETLRVVK